MQAPLDQYAQSGANTGYAQNQGSYANSSYSQSSYGDPQSAYSTTGYDQSQQYNDYR